MREIEEVYDKKRADIRLRLQKFKRLNEEDYVKEFIFCLLTPQSNAQRCWEAVEQIFSLKKNELNEEDIAKILSKKTRFHNIKAKRVMLAFNQWEIIKRKLDETDNINAYEKSLTLKVEPRSIDFPQPSPNSEGLVILRNWLAENVNGYGLKEASHFLRNIGRSENKIAILDRHILRNLKNEGIILQDKIKSKKDYMEIERNFKEFSEKIKIPIDELDLLWWSKENGEIFK